MMTLEQFYLIKIAEEATELAQAALKASQFGLFEMSPGAKTNEELMTQELNDLLAVVGMLRCNHYEYSVLVEDSDLQLSKQNKVVGWLEYSQSLGLVEKE